MHTWTVMKAVIGAGVSALVVTVTFMDRVACVSQVVGVSMQPLLNPECNARRTDWVLQNRLAATQQHLDRGDIVTFITPYDPTSSAVKRIIGLEGDLVRTKNAGLNRSVVPSGHVWVEGDNSRHSHDSNSYGPISMSLITSKVTHVVWPPSRWQKLRSGWTEM